MRGGHCVQPRGKQERRRQPPASSLSSAGRRKPSKNGFSQNALRGSGESGGEKATSKEAKNEESLSVPAAPGGEAQY
ncbi:hypothetical protein MRX96_009136 [Rhipicephalus microplus]